jgi:membrane-bound lytic murein transglycosylase A
VHCQSSVSGRKIICLLFLLLLVGCPSKPSEQAEQTATLVRVSDDQVPSFFDDLDLNSLQIAIKQSLKFYERIPADRTFNLGHLQIRAEVLKSTLLIFLSLIDSGRLDPESVCQAFDIYCFQQGKSQTELLLTGYYEPILNGKLEPDEVYCYPLYSVPPDLLIVDLAAFDPDLYAGKKLTARLEGTRVVPYYNREQIDGRGKLRGKGCELLWLANPLDAFFLQIQGSGMIQLPQGKVARVGYAASNGRPYRSIGRLLVDKGAMNREEVTLQSIRAYLEDHPEIQEEVLWHNESYVFFRWVDDGPLGSMNVPLTAGRSIATDPQYFPRGGIAFLQSEQPRFDLHGRVTGWEPLHRFVLNQDVGGAIKGVKRADLFCGSGEPAEQVAGRLKHPGKLYFLIKKQ